MRLFPVAIPVGLATNSLHMVAEWLQRLLILQDRDSRCDSIQRQLESIPDEIRKEEAAIRELDEQLAVAEKELKQMEVRRLDLEGEVAQAEEHVVKYKTQQMQVKKNEEYTALEKEITTLKERISELEDQELQVMEELESKQLALEELRSLTRQQQETLQAHIARLRQNYESSAGELDAAKEAVVACEKEIDPSVLQNYRYVKSQVKRPPVVVPLEDGRCQGCHLKVSGDVESQARRGNELVRCDTCGRILYYDR